MLVTLSLCMVLNHAFHSAVLGGLRSQEDSWIFEDPVTESIAPGYFEVIDTPMDYTTVEKKIEGRQYQDQEQVIYNDL